MNVGLARLRDARQFASPNTAEREYLTRTADAVLDAPTLWWCATDMRGDAKPIPDDSAIVATRGRCGGCGSLPASSGCRWVALVPIEGKN